MIVYRRSYAVSLLLLCVFFYCYFQRWQRTDSDIPSTNAGLTETTYGINLTAEDQDAQLPPKAISKSIVMAERASDNSSWVEELLPGWVFYAYETDNPAAELRVPVNKGRESMVYLT